MSPVAYLFLERSIVVPHCFIPISHTGHCFCITNVGVQKYAIARAICVVPFTPVDDSYFEAIHTLDTYVKHEPQVTSSKGNDQELIIMIDPGLASSKKRQMFDLLRQYRGIFDQAAMTVEFGNASVVVHRIDIFRSFPTKTRNYRV